MNLGSNPNLFYLFFRNLVFRFYASTEVYLPPPPPIFLLGENLLAPPSGALVRVALMFPRYFFFPPELDRAYLIAQHPFFCLSFNELIFPHGNQFPRAYSHLAFFAQASCFFPRVWDHRLSTGWFASHRILPVRAFEYFVHFVWFFWEFQKVLGAFMLSFSAVLRCSPILSLLISCLFSYTTVPYVLSSTKRHTCYFPPQSFCAVSDFFPITFFQWAPWMQ